MRKPERKPAGLVTISLELVQDNIMTRFDTFLEEFFAAGSATLERQKVREAAILSGSPDALAALFEDEDDEDKE